MCSCEDAEPARLYFERYRRARKLQPCSECDVPIQRGSWYLEITMLHEDVWHYDKQCLLCHARHEAWHVVECNAPISQLHESIVECLVSGRTIDRETGRKYLAAKRDARARIELQVNEYEAAQRRRYHNGAVAREAAKRLRSVPDRVT